MHVVCNKKNCLPVLFSVNNFAIVAEAMELLYFVVLCYNQILICISCMILLDMY